MAKRIAVYSPVSALKSGVVKFIFQCVPVRFAVLLLLGLGLSGCFQPTGKSQNHYLLQLDGTGLDADRLAQARETARSQLQKRLQTVGAQDIKVTDVGTNRLNITFSTTGQMEGIDFGPVVSKRGLAEFRLVHPDSEVLVKEKHPAPEGYELLVMESDDKKESLSYMVKLAPELGLTSRHITSTLVTHNPIRARDPIKRNMEINLKMNAEGAKLLEKITSEHTPTRNQIWQLAVVVDGKLVTAPRIMTAIPGGETKIMGTFKLQEAVEIAWSIQAPLPVPVKIVEPVQP